MRILLLLLLYFLKKCLCRTAADEFNELQYGSGKVLLGAYIGDNNLITQGISEKGDINAIMTPFLGEKVLQLGKILENFPIAPALHLTFYHSQKDHLDTAFFMMNRGANPNKFELPSHYSEDYKYEYMKHMNNPSVSNNKYKKDNIVDYLNISYGYPPAIMYCLGLGMKPKDSHAAFLQRIYQSLPSHFNLTVLDLWRNLTGNPPILQIPLLLDFFQGAYALVEDLKFEINVEDEHGITPLHIAAWKGDKNLLWYLLSRGAAISVDKMGRTPLHYAAMRGHGDIIIEIFKSFHKNKSKDYDDVKIAGQRKQDALKIDLIKTKDNNGKSALQLAALPPSLTTVIRPIRKEMTKLKITAEARWSRAPKTEVRSINVESDINSRGGWYYPNNFKKSNDKNDEKTDIDVIKAAKFTRKLFINEYFSTQRPLLITDNLFNKQYIWLYWEKNTFVNRYGDIIVKKGERLHSTEKNPWTLSKPETITVKEYVEKYMNNNCEDDINNNNGFCYNNDKNSIDDYINNPIEDPWVAFTNNSQIILNDIKKPHALRICGNQDNENIKLMLGPAGTGIPMHSHNASWNLLLTGKKKWYLVAPGHAAYYEDDDNAAFKAGKGAFDYHIKPTTEWLRDVAPKLRSKGLLHEVMQYPGDVIYIPHDWHHATLNLADTVAISQEFCTFKNTVHRIMPLGAVVYGNKDEFRNSGSINTFQEGDSQRIDRYKKEMDAYDNVPQFNKMDV